MPLYSGNSGILSDTRLYLVRSLTATFTTVELGTVKASGNFLIPHEICLLMWVLAPHTMCSYLKALIYFTFMQGRYFRVESQCYWSSSFSQAPQCLRN